MKYLNLGCGSHYVDKKDWINIDFSSDDPKVIEHNLLQGIPFNTDTFDVVYHSHVLEHFSKEDGEIFIKECFKVLKKGGVLRIAIPNLEEIARKYIYFLEQGINNPDNKQIEANYEWMKIEMIDQIARHSNGGNMIKILSQKKIINESFIYERIGEEGRDLRRKLIQTNTNLVTSLQKKKKKPLGRKIKYYLLNKLLIALNINQKHLVLGSFRLKGEIHQWMYDRYSLTKLLKQYGGIEIEVKTAFDSYIPKWKEFNLDGTNNQIRKPDSLFIECKKR